MTPPSYLDVKIYLGSEYSGYLMILISISQNDSYTPRSMARIVIIIMYEIESLSDMSIHVGESAKEFSVRSPMLFPS